MDHIAIMKKSLGLLPKILTGEKTIESRWYKHRIAPWNKIKAGDTVYFKNAGEVVTAVATVSQIRQWQDLDEKLVTEILNQYGDRICLHQRAYNKYYQAKKYCILIFLTNPQTVTTPFRVSKQGYGNACAWMCVESVEAVRIN